MCGTATTTNDLGLTDKNAGCACGHGHGHSPATTEASTASALVTTDLPVTGMTCGHCVSSVTEELSSLAGVESVTVQLNAGGVSTVTVASTTPLDPAAIRAAVDEAGYALAEA
ncbi:MAG: heavy-metal-associated domain-containing protein [Microbacteriaceae bacterium]